MCLCVCLNYSSILLTLLSLLRILKMAFLKTMCHLNSMNQ